MDFKAGELYFLSKSSGSTHFVKILAAGPSTVYVRPYGKPPSLRWWLEPGVPTLWVDPQPDDITAGPPSGAGVRVLELSRETLAACGPVYLRVQEGHHAEEWKAMTRIELKHIPVIGEELLSQLKRLDASRDGALEYRPGRVHLRDGSVVDRVCVVEAGPYIRHWRVWPKHDRGRSEVSLADVDQVEESAQRVPAELATKMYQAGESSMGGCFFVLVLKDGRRLPCETGNSVDFIEYPAGVDSSDVVDLLPHDRGKPEDWRPGEGRFWKGADFAWCLYRIRG